MTAQNPTSPAPITPTRPSRVLVIGGTTSIGAPMMQSLRAAGLKVLATGRAWSAADAGDGIQRASLDLADPQSLDRFASEVVPAFGSIDMLLFLAGILPGKCLADYTDAMIDEVMTVNFSAQAALLRRLLPHFSEPAAQVLMIASISGERGSFDPIYAASKAAQIAFVKSLATWLAPAIRVNAIAPALIESSSMFNDMTPERRAYHLAQTPTQRLTTAQELAGIVVDLCGPTWSNLNGQVIRINGGAHV